MSSPAVPSSRPPRMSIQEILQSPGDLKLEELSSVELYWKEQYEWLLKAGYRLRTRYSPDWQPSWIGTNYEPLDCEDAQRTWYAGVNHAIRVETGRFVTIKKVDELRHPDEISITKFLSDGSLAADDRNHTVPLIEVLQHPTDATISFLVLPLLRDYDNPPFQTMGEAIDFISQFFTGVNFLHENRIAHGDISINNILMDASGIYPEGFHPCRPNLKADFSDYASTKYTRTEKPPVYYLIDFGISRLFEEEEYMPMERIGTDISVPEYKDASQEINPFYVDVYCVGNMIRCEFLDGHPNRRARPGYYGFEFLRPLITDMIRHNSTERPTMAEVVERFEKAVKELSTSTLRSQCRQRLTVGDKDPLPIAVATSILYWYKRIVFTIRRIPAIPKR